MRRRIITATVLLGLLLIFSALLVYDANALMTGNLVFRINPFTAIGPVWRDPSMRRALLITWGCIVFTDAIVWLR